MLTEIESRFFTYLVMGAAVVGLSLSGPQWRWVRSVGCQKCVYRGGALLVCEDARCPTVHQRDGLEVNLAHACFYCVTRSKLASLQEVEFNENLNCFLKLFLKV